MKYTAYGLVVASALLGQAAYADEWASLATRTTIENDRICYSDATDIICDSSAPTLTDINSLVSSGGGLWTATGSDIYFTGGKVGIGTNTPAAPLDIKSSHGAYGAMLLGGGTTNNAGFITFANPSGAVHGRVGYNGLDSHNFVVQSNSGSGTISLITGAVERMHVANTGNIGIGTTSPVEPLHIYTADQTDLTMMLSNSEGTNLKVGNVIFGTEERLGLYSNEDLGLRADGRVNLRSRGNTWSTPFTMDLQDPMTKGGDYNNVFLALTGTYAPSTNNGDFRGIDANFTINQTGTTTGDYTALRLRLAKTASVGNGYLIRGFLGSSENFAVTEAGSVRATELCDETGANCKDLSAGLSVSGDTIMEGDTAVEAVDSGTDGVITFDIDGAEVARFDNSGNLTLGVAAADTELTLDYDNGETGGVFFKKDSAHTFALGMLEDDLSGLAGRFAISHYSGGYQPDFVIDTDGDVGIGTTSPSSALNIYDDDSSATGAEVLTITGNYLSGGTAGAGSHITFDDMAGNEQTRISSIVTSGNRTGLVFSTGVYSTDGSTERMRIDGNGNVGIGTATPAADTKLDVAGAIKIAATETETCAATEDLGKIRFNSTLGKFQICRP